MSHPKPACTHTLRETTRHCTYQALSKRQGTAVQGCNGNLFMHQPHWRDNRTVWVRFETKAVEGYTQEYFLRSGMGDRKNKRSVHSQNWSCFRVFGHTTKNKQTEIAESSSLILDIGSKLLHRQFLCLETPSIHN